MCDDCGCRTFLIQGLFVMGVGKSCCFFGHRKIEYTKEYVERNQEMIDNSDFCIVYYRTEYKPPIKRNSIRHLADYQPKSGTKIAYDYAKKKRKTIISL